MDIFLVEIHIELGLTGILAIKLLPAKTSVTTKRMSARIGHEVIIYEKLLRR